MKTIKKVNLFYGEKTIAQCFLGDAITIGGKSYYSIDWKNPVYFELPAGKLIKDELLGKALSEVKLTKVEVDEKPEESEALANVFNS